jgi:sulfite exporter TauE/SafE
MQNYDLIGYFSIGFFGGFGHCLGMCHPFILYVSGKFVGNTKGYKHLLLPHIFYNLGRITTYVILGIFAGLIGNIAEFAGNLMGIQKVASIIAGIFLLAYGILSFTGYNLLNKFEQQFAVNKIMCLIKKFQPKHSYTTGLLLGLLPCGLIYGVLIAASSTANILKAAIGLFLFGLGTMFAMMTASIFGNFLMKKRNIFNFLSLILLTFMGCYFIYLGIRL